MSALAMQGMEELSPDGAVRVRGGNHMLAAAVAIGGMMATSFGAGFRWGYDVLGPWLAENVF
jgi:hypothetical protein